MAGISNGVIYGNNVDFSGGSPISAKIVANGQLLIGTTALNAGGTHVNVGTLTCPDGSVTIGYSSPNITLTATGGGGSLPDPVTAPHGGTGLISPTAHSLLVAEGASAFAILGVATNGQIPIGSTGADPVLATITAGANITVTNLPGSITIASSGGGGGGLSWSVITANQTAAVNNGYVCNKAGVLALALPAASVVGDIIEITGMNTALGWSVTQGAGQQIFFGTNATTSGVGGSLASTQIRDSIRMVCIVTNLTWNVLSSIGNITVV